MCLCVSEGLCRLSLSLSFSLSLSRFVLAPLHDLFIWPLTFSWSLHPFESLFVFVILPTVSCATAPSPPEQGDATQPTLTALEEGHTHGRHTPSALGECTHTHTHIHTHNFAEATLNSVVYIKKTLIKCTENQVQPVSSNCRTGLAVLVNLHCLPYGEGK